MRFPQCHLFPSVLLAGRQLGSIHQRPDSQQPGAEKTTRLKAALPLTNWEVTNVLLNLPKLVLTSINRDDHSLTSARGIPLRRKEVWIQED